jgi:hypothetical protein
VHTLVRQAKEPRRIPGAHFQAASPQNANGSPGRNCSTPAFLSRPPAQHCVRANRLRCHCRQVRVIDDSGGPCVVDEQAHGINDASTRLIDSAALCVGIRQAAPAACRASATRAVSVSGRAVEESLNPNAAAGARGTAGSAVSPPDLEQAGLEGATSRLTRQSHPLKPQTVQFLRRPANRRLEQRETQDELAPHRLRRPRPSRESAHSQSPAPDKNAISPRHAPSSRSGAGGDASASTRDIEWSFWTNFTDPSASRDIMAAWVCRLTFPRKSSPR